MAIEDTAKFLAELRLRASSNTECSGAIEELRALCNSEIPLVQLPELGELSPLVDALNGSLRRERLYLRFALVLMEELQICREREEIRRRGKKPPKFTPTEKAQYIRGLQEIGIDLNPSTKRPKDETILISYFEQIFRSGNGRPGLASSPAFRRKLKALRNLISEERKKNKKLR